MNPVLGAARCVKHRLDFVVHPWARNSIHQLTVMKDTHRGERCFIIGNGPSLQQTNIRRLQNEHTFGMNRLYMLFPELGFHTSYFVSVNYLVIKQCIQDILPLPMPKFLPWSCRRYVSNPTKDTIFLDATCALLKPGFYTDMRRPIWISATVTFIALELAYFMGFKQVILIGVDHNFATKGPAGQRVISQGDDPNHFSPQYFGKGFEWQLPDLETSEIGYRFARQAFEKDGRQVLDATIGGKLTIFPKVDYNSLF